MFSTVRDNVGKVSEDIYSKQLQIIIKEEYSKERSSKITISAHSTLATSDNDKEKGLGEFVVTLTDETDPLFYYHLHLNDKDYQSLCVQKGLLGEFQSFPHYFVKLLDKCYRAEKSDSPKYVLQLQLLNNAYGELNIVKVKPFKHLSLTLKLVLGNDGEVKRYLADTVRELKLKHEQLYTSLKATESKLDKCLRESTDNLRALSTDNEKLKNELKEQSLLLTERFGHQLTQEKDRIIQIQRDLHEKYERERRELEYNRNKIVGTLEGNNIELELKVRELTDKQNRYESTVTDMKNTIGMMENELLSLRAHNLEMNEVNRRLEENKVDYENAQRQMSSTLANLERKSRESDTTRIKLQEALDTVHEQSNRLKSDHEQNLSKLRKRESSVAVLSEEVNKANAIIGKLQEELRKCYDKLRERTKVVVDQEKVVKQKEKQTDELQSEARALQQTIQMQDNEITSLKQSLNELQIKADEAEKSLKTNENVINWLNKQLNEAELNQRKASHNPLSSSTPIGGGENQAKRTVCSGSAEAFKPTMESLAADEKDELAPEESTPSSKENKSQSLNAKYLCPRPTLRGLSKDRAPNKESVPKNYNIRLPKSTVSPLGPNGASSRFPVTFQPSSYFPS